MSRNVFIAAALFVFVGAVVLINLPYGAIKLSKAEELMLRRLVAEDRLNPKHARVDVILPDGGSAAVRPAAITEPKAIACPISKSNAGGIHGRWGGPTIYRATTYSCLFDTNVSARHGLLLGMLITRSSDPELEDLGGYDTHMLETSQVLSLMEDLGLSVDKLSAAESTALRNDLKERDVLFPGSGG
ncbi:MAG: hypothetical protein AAGE61_05895 [Pseudomonadota bacterium]